MLLQFFKGKMLHLTADVRQEKEDDHNITLETGIFVTHSPTKAYSKNNFVNMLPRINTTTLLFMLLVFLICFKQHCLASLEEPIPAATKSSGNYFNSSPPAAYECNSMSLRYNCRDFQKLSNCTVITGFLSISQYFGPLLTCNEPYKFENLREITDFLMFSELRNFTSIKDLFPNLTVIRGRRLFRNYALVFSSDYDLEKIEFKSLIALQRGHVLVEGLEKLCYIEKINWARLALSKGKSNIYPHSKAICPKKAKCWGCKRDACWSNEVCQKFEDDSVLSQAQDPKTECHTECLGGCYNSTAQGCVVCKGYTDHGTCVKECPKDKYTCSLYLRCYTREECVKDKELLIFNNTCVEECPVGYKKNNATKVCEPCDKIKEDCLRTCDGDGGFDTTIYVTSISMAESLKYCQILRGSLVIEMFEYFDPEELKTHLKNLKEITGYLKINRAPFLISLSFLENLERIHGQTLDNDQFALIIYNNIRLAELWNLKPNFEISNGGIYIHANSKLCNRRIKDFRQGVKHDNSLDSIQKGDQEVLCSPATLNLNIQVINHRSLKLYWLKNETASEVEIIYKPVGKDELVIETSELDPNVCNRINWHRELKFADELPSNITHYIYVVQGLEPRTRYALLVKTFNGDDDDTKEARSEVKYVTTKIDIPRAPTILIESKTFDTLSIKFYPDIINALSPQSVEYFNFEVYDMPDKKDMLDKRNFCDDPASVDFREFRYEDYDTCCSRLESERQEKVFLSKLRQEFSCSLDHKEYCKQVDQNINDKTMRKAIIKERFELQLKTLFINGLKPFHLYVLRMQACNRAGCSSYTILSERTNYSLTADEVTDFSCCRDQEANEYKFFFTEPKQQNGYITSYILHLRYHNFSEGNMSVDRNAIMCVTPSEHERNHYVSTKQSEIIFNQAALKVVSFGRHSFIAWVNITDCATVSTLPPVAGYTAGFVLIITIGVLTWLCLSRGWWQRTLQYLRDCVPLHAGWRYIRPWAYINEDRHGLVDGFQLYSYRDIQDDIELQEL